MLLIVVHRMTTFLSGTRFKKREGGRNGMKGSKRGHVLMLISNQKEENSPLGHFGPIRPVLGR
jgi:hypothetical protein